VLKDELLGKIKILATTIWEDKNPKVFQKWRENFQQHDDPKKCEELHALYLLSQFMYFGSRQMRYLLKSLYRDQFRYPVIESIRKANGNTTNLGFINSKYDEELKNTRFLGVGNPSESGCHLLYYFRQENILSKDLFIHTHEIFTRKGREKKLALKTPSISRYVFIDDFTGSGEQAGGYSKEIISDIKALNPDAVTEYILLFATQKGLQSIRAATKFDYVRSVFELDETYKCFGPKSRYNPPAKLGLDWSFAKSMCEKYGSIFATLDDSLYGHTLGYKDCQLMIGFNHNTPDNSLPIFWFDNPKAFPWDPVFRRYPKVYGSVDKS
jgi:hypothetical protein